MQSNLMVSLKKKKKKHQRRTQLINTARLLIYYVFETETKKLRYPDYLLNFIVRQT